MLSFSGMSLWFSYSTVYIYFSSLTWLHWPSVELQWKMFNRSWPHFVLVPFGPMREHHTLTALRELILNSSTDLKVMAMGCGYGLIPTMLTIPLMEKWQRETGWLWLLICSAILISLQSHGLLNYSLVLLLCFIFPVPQTHTHFIFHSHRLMSDLRV